MAPLSTLLGLLTLALVTTANAAVNDPRGATGVCKEIQDRVSAATDVVFPYQVLTFNDAIRHWFLSSQERPECVVLAGSALDVSAVLQIVGPARTPFAVYSGGHASNPGFSSTKGVHISLERLSEISLAEDQKTVKIGFGAIWKDVYEALEPFGVNVVGGRVIGPAVGGLTLGGGYSWRTNQYGLTVDTVKLFNVILPNGTLTTASEIHNPDLFFALKGGLNRFGIVTSAEFYTHPQPPKVWGGLRLYSRKHVPQLLNATERFFYENTDPKSAIITTINGDGLGTSAMVLFFHDGPKKPKSLEVFDGIPAQLDNVGTKSFTGLVGSFPAYLVQNVRGTFATISTSELSARFLKAIEQEAADIGKISALHSGTAVSYDIEPFTAYGEHATESAFPHADSPLPLNLYFAWANPKEDQWWYARMKESIKKLKQVAIEDGIYLDSFTAYPNYAISGTTAEELYGPANAARLRSIRSHIDPDRVMDLAGGFDI